LALDRIDSEDINQVNTNLDKHLKLQYVLANHVMIYVDIEVKDIDSMIIVEFHSMVNKHLLNTMILNKDIDLKRFFHVK